MALDSANLAGAILGKTVLADAASLARAHGLAEVSHAAGSTVDLAMLRVLAGTAPAVFLEGLGVSPADLAGLGRGTAAV